MNGSLNGASASSPVGTSTATALADYDDGYDDAFWATRIATLTQSPIYGSDGTLIGSVDTGGSLDPQDAARRAFIPLVGPIPPIYEAAIVFLENRNFGTDGIHNLCGLDLPVTAGRVIWSMFRDGGSTISQQLTKELLEYGGGTDIFTRAWRKAEEFGASCRLYRYLENQGGRDAVLRLYASYAGTAQGNGTLRGIEAGSSATGAVSSLGSIAASSCVSGVSTKGVASPSVSGSCGWSSFFFSGFFFGI